jgi:nucleoid-associated protein YgaU
MSVATELDPTVSIPARARPQAQPEAPVRLASVTVLHAPRALPVATPVRLTQRGVLVLALAVALLGVGLVWLARSSAPHAADVAPAPHSVTVRSGDTLWSIATRVAPNRDPRAEVAALQQRNRLIGVQLTPGQVLRVP